MISAAERQAGETGDVFERTVLPNGLRIITSEMPQTRSATVSVYVGAGSRYEEDAEAGLSHFLEHMLFKGASRRPTAQEIAEAIESVGGLHNAATDRELTVYYAKTPDFAALETIDILSDMVTAPEMDPVELEKERMVILEELASVEDNPASWPPSSPTRRTGPTSPSGATSAAPWRRRARCPSRRSSATSARSTCPRTWSCRWRATSRTRRWSRRPRAGWAPPPRARPTPGDPVEERGERPRVGVRTKATEQAHLCLTYPALPLGHEDQYAAGLVSALLGEGMSSRLFLELREERALVYDVHSYMSEYRDAGAFTVYAGCDPANARVTLEAAREEIDRFLCDAGDEELEKGKRMVAGRIQLRMEDTRSVAAWLGGQELVLDEVLTVDEVVAMVDGVTLDDLRRVGGDLLRPEAATLAAVGPFEDDAVFAGVI